MKKVALLFLLCIFFVLSACTENTKTSAIPEKASVSENVTSDEKYVDIVRNFECFATSVSRGVEMRYDDWTNFEYDNYDDLRFVINSTYYTNGLGLDGKSMDGYDMRNFSETTYVVVDGKYDQITGVFGFDDRTPCKPSVDLILLQDGEEVFRTSIDEKEPYKEIVAELSENMEEMKFRLEISDVTDRMPMIIFADIKARVFDEARVRE